MKTKEAFLLLNLFLFFQIINAQSVKDSIQQLIIVEKNETKKIDLICQLAQTFQRKSTDSVILYANQSLEMAENINYDLGEANANKSLAWAYYHRSENEKSISSCLKAIKYYKRTKNNSLPLGNCTRLLAAIYIKEKKYDKAIKNLLKAKDLIEKIESNNTEHLTIVLNDIAYLYLELANYEMAMQYLNTSIATAKANDRTATLADSYNILATINSKEGDYNNAIKFYNLSKEIYTKKKDLLGTAACLTNIGITYYRQENYLQAIDFLEKAGRLNKELNYNSGLMNSRIFLSKSYIKINNLKTADYFLKEAANTAKEHNLSITEIIVAKAELAIKNKQNSKAKKFIENYLHQENLILVPGEKIELYKTLYKVHENNNNFKDAFYSKNEYQRIKDSINNNRRATQVNVLQAEFNYKKIQSDLKESGLKLSVLEEKNKASKLTSISLIIGGVLLAFISVLIYKRKKDIWKKDQELQTTKQEALNSDIKHKNKQITDFALHISEKNELLLKIKNKIKKIRTIKKDDSKISGLLLFINNNLDYNDTKVALYSNVDSTTDDFYQKIKKQYSNLSDQEIRIAILVRLDLTSKQIGMRLNLTKESVNNYRYTLRKKMNIPKDVFLYDVLKKI